MGFLDFLDNPDILNQLLGVGAMNGGPMPQPAAPQQPAPQPLPQMSAPTPAPGIPLPPPRPPMDVDAALSDDPNAGVPASGAPGAPPLPPLAQASFSPGVPLPRPAPGGMSEQGKNDTFAQRFDASDPGLGTYRPSGDETGMVGGAGGATRGIDVSAARRLPPGGVPLPPPAVNGGPQSESPVSLAAQFGLDPDRIARTKQQDNMRAMLSGVGKGLSAVGNAPVGATAGQMFARGAGGALEGTANAQEAQKKTLFDQSTSAFNSMLRADAASDASAYRGAQMKYLEARAKSIEAMTKQGRASSAYQNSPEYKVLKVEQMADKYRTDEMKALREQWKLDNASKADREADTKELEARVQAHRNELYQRSGINPNEAQRIKTRGLTKDNPFDGRTMTPEEFEARVPQGGFFINPADGKVYRRTKPPTSGQASPAGTETAQDRNDDNAAMTAASAGDEEAA